MEKLLTEEQRKRFIASVLSKNDCYYVWPDESNNYSGKDLKGAKYPRTYDCSGLVTSSLYDATGIDKRATWNAQKLMEHCGLVDSPLPGDLCFYGPSRTLITHVMVYIGKSQEGFKGKTVIGASGGDSRNLTPGGDAKVKAYKTHLYRPDFIAFGRLISKD